MNILTFTQLFPNALQPVSGIFIYQRILHFSRRPGNEVKVVAPVPFIPRWLPSHSREIYKHIPEHEIIGGLAVDYPRYPHLPSVVMSAHGFLMFLGCYRLVAKLHRERRFDCIDSHFIYPDGFAAVLLGKMLGIPVFCSARGTDITLYPSFRLIRPLIRWTLRRAAGIIAVSNSLKESMVNLGVPAEKIRVIGNGVDLKRFAPMDRGEARRQLGLPEDSRMIVSVAGLHPHKGHQILISALDEIRRQFPSLRLYVLGEGPYRPALQRLIAEKNLQEHVFLKGSRSNEELKFWYNAADLSCLSSAREGWPNVLLESLSCGTPVLATRVGGVPEVITSPELGLMVERSIQAIAEGLKTALRKSWNRDALVRYARMRTWDDVAAEMERYLAQCL